MPTEAEPATPSSFGWMRRVAACRLRVVLEPLRGRRWKLPPRPAVMLRGALGRALVAEACAHPPEVEGEDLGCARCPDRDGCPVPGWYAPLAAEVRAVRPVVPEVRAEGGDWVERTAPLDLSLLVLGAEPPLDLLVRAVARMAGDGLGPSRVRHRIRGIGLEPRRDDPGRAATTLADLAQLPDGPAAATVQVHTPVRWKRAGPQRPPTPDDFLRVAVLRVRQVCAAQGFDPDRWWPRRLPGAWCDARWVRGRRYSAHQGRDVSLAGWSGSVRFDGPVDGLADLLAAAEVLHVGRATSAGLGRVSVTWRPVAS